ncbi:MAG: L,D-transpeptidase [Candidatus Aenigmatarchaeota archaeon]
MKVSRRDFLGASAYASAALNNMLTGYAAEPGKVILVEKTKRNISLYRDGVLEHSYRIGLGGNPIDDKTRSGDSCTPEGEFHVVAKVAPHQSFYKLMLIDYPSEPHALRGYRSGIITNAEYNAIVNAHRANGTPSQWTALGGDICIHGGGSDRDWTLGCVALDNKDIDVVYVWTPMHTKVIIEK